MKFIRVLHAVCLQPSDIRIDTFYFQSCKVSTLSHLVADLKLQKDMWLLQFTVKNQIQTFSEFAPRFSLNLTDLFYLVQSDISPLSNQIMSTKNHIRIKTR